MVTELRFVWVLTSLNFDDMSNSGLLPEVSWMCVYMFHVHNVHMYM